MEWLWMPAVAIISLFVLLLCWLFFKDYTCFPCRRKRRPELDVSFTSGTVTVPSAPEALHYIGHHQAQPLTLADLYDLTETGSTTICLLRGSCHVSEVLTLLKGYPQLDLHNMTVSEAILYTQRFLNQSKGKTPIVYIVTGRGVHSKHHIPKIKPAVENLLRQKGYNFTVMHDGGCYEVALL